MASEFVSDSSLYIYILHATIDFILLTLYYVAAFSLSFLCMYYNMAHEKIKVQAISLCEGGMTSEAGKRTPVSALVGILHKCTTPRAFSL